MFTNYEEVCRRVEVIAERIREVTEKNPALKAGGDAFINVYRAELLALQEAYLGDEESDLREKLRAPYTGSALVVDRDDELVLDFVSGLIGIGPECRLPDEFMSHAD